MQVISGISLSSSLVQVISEIPQSPALVQVIGEIPQSPTLVQAISGTSIPAAVPCRNQQKRLNPVTGAAFPIEINPKSVSWCKSEKIKRSLKP